MALASPSGYLVVVGASAGGVRALQQLTESLPADFPAAVCVVQHVGSNLSILPELLSRCSPLQVVHARDGTRLQTGVIYMAPPDCHMLVDGQVLRLTRGPRENHTRPAIDPLFRSAALHWGARVIGVILTGFLDDGTAGLAAVKARGGIAIVEDPDSAYESSMPLSALQNVAVDYCLPVAEIGPLLARLVGEEVAQDPPAPEALRREVAINMGENIVENLVAIAKPSSLTCPDCGGTLFEVDKQRPLRYRCHTGHAFTARTLESAQAEASEHALRSGIRALAEREFLLRRMAAVSRGVGEARQAEVALRHADQLQAQIAVLRGFAETVEGEGITETESQDPGPA